MEKCKKFNSINKIMNETDLLKRPYAKMRPLQNFILGEYYIDITSKSRRREKIDLVKIFVHYVKENYPTIPYSTIAKFLNRDHSTIVVAKQRHDDLCEGDLEFKKKSVYLQSKFNKLIADESDPWKRKLEFMIENSSEKMRKIFYHAIMIAKTYTEK